VLVQLPKDAESMGYKKSPTNRFEFNQVFHSEEHNFTGTERDFVAAGLAHEYIELDKFRRLIVNS